MDKKKDYIQATQMYNKLIDSTESDLFFNNLIWLTTKETAVYLRKSVNAIHTLVSRKYLMPRKFARRLYFKKEELDYLLETSIKGGC